MKLVKTVRLSSVVRWILIGAAVLLGIVMFQIPLFAWNIPVMIAYTVFVFILLGRTKTNRPNLTQFFSVLRNKKKQAEVAEELNLNSISRSGLGQKEIYFDTISGLSLMFAKSARDNLWYVPVVVSSNITLWSDSEDYEQFISNLLDCERLLTGGEKMLLANTRDLDVAMSDLADGLEKVEIEDPYIATLQQERITNLRFAGSEYHKTVQQYVVFGVRRENIGKVLGPLIRDFSVQAPTYPYDVLLSVLGSEAGLYLQVEEPIKKKG